MLNKWVGVQGLLMLCADITKKNKLNSLEWGQCFLHWSHGDPSSSGIIAIFQYLHKEGRSWTLYNLRKFFPPQICLFIFLNLLYLYFTFLPSHFPNDLQCSPLHHFIQLGLAESIWLASMAEIWDLNLGLLDTSLKLTAAPCWFSLWGGGCH